MKLRNKKTGEIMPLCGNSFLGQYKSLAEFNEEWEDYKPAEPLIKDEKVRKAIRAWAEANKIDQKHYYDIKVEFDYYEHRLKWIGTSIEFNNITGLETLDDGEKYTIAELCGEEEE